MFKTIYEQLTPGQPAVYQIKFKGSISSSLEKLTKNLRVSTESFDTQHPVTMLTGQFKGQTELLNLMNAIHKEGYSIISVACIEIPADNGDYATV